MNLTLGLSLTSSTILRAGTPDPLKYSLDFQNAVYKGDTLTNMLGEAGNYVGGLYEREDNGNLVSVAANQVQITSNGLEVWQNRTNAAFQSRDLTNATWTKTGVTVARSTGRNGSANQGSRVTVVSADGTAELPVTTETINNFIGAVDIKRVSGTGGASMTVDGGATWVALTGVSTSWQRLRIPTQNLATPKVMFKFDTAGDVFDMDYVTCQSGTILGPRIATTTARVNCPQNRATCLNKPPLRDFIKGGAYTAFWKGKMDANGGRGIFVSDANFNCSVQADGSISWGTASKPAGTFAFGVDQTVCISRDAAGVSRISVNGGAIATGTVGSPAALTHFDISTNGAGAFNIAGVVRKIAFYTPLTDSQMMTLA